MFFPRICSDLVESLSCISTNLSLKSVSSPNSIDLNLHGISPEITCIASVEIVLQTGRQEYRATLSDVSVISIIDVLYNSPIHIAAPYNAIAEKRPLHQILVVNKQGPHLFLRAFSKGAAVFTSRTFMSLIFHIW
mgnify:CR=1 FL=1